MIRVSVHPKILIWARERAGYDVTLVAERLPKLPS